MDIRVEDLLLTSTKVAQEKEFPRKKIQELREAEWNFYLSLTLLHTHTHTEIDTRKIEKVHAPVPQL